MKRMISVSALFVIGALALTGCSDDDDADDASSSLPSVTVPESADVTPTDIGAGPLNLPGPGFDQCLFIVPADDGHYSVFDAGTAVVTRQGNRLVLGDAQAADGWTAHVDREKRRDVQVEFERGAEREVLDTEIVDGRLSVKICSDDD